MDARKEAIVAEFKERAEQGIAQVCVGVPSNDQVSAQFAFSMMAMSFYCARNDIPLAFVNQKGSMLPKNRNNLVEDARNLHCSQIGRASCRERV